MANTPTVSELLKLKVVNDAQLSSADDAALANLNTGQFELASGWLVDLTAAVRADRNATVTLKEPTARPGSKQAAVKSVTLLLPNTEYERGAVQQMMRRLDELARGLGLDEPTTRTVVE